MDFEKLRVFIRVAETGSITDAAEQLNITQSGVSYIIRTIEREVGFALFVRDRRGVSLTSSGQALLPLARDILGRYETLGRTIVNIRKIDYGTIKIGSYVSVAAYGLPKVISRFKQRYPGVSLEIMEGSSALLNELLESNSVDFAFTSPQQRVGFEWIDLHTDPLKAVLAQAHPLAAAGRVPMSAFETEPFIPSSLGYDYDMSRVLSVNQIHPPVACTSMDERTIIALVRHGVGVSILSEMMLRSLNVDGVAVKDLDPPATRQLGIAVRSLKHATPAARAFIECAIGLLRVRPDGHDRAEAARPDKA